MGVLGEIVKTQKIILTIGLEQKKKFVLIVSRDDAEKILMQRVTNDR
jgi:hypothetical protein